MCLPMTTHDLPTQSTSFVGRTAELADIANLLADPACRLVTVLGPGGIGKTRLTIQAAQQHLDTFADGVYFVPLAPVGSADLLASAIAGALKLSFFGSDSPDTQIINYLAGQDA